MPDAPNKDNLMNQKFVNIKTDLIIDIDFQLILP